MWKKNSLTVNKKNPDLIPIVSYRPPLGIGGQRMQDYAPKAELPELE